MWSGRIFSIAGEIMKKNLNSPAVRFLYGTRPGRILLRWLLQSRMDRLAVRFLCSKFSRPLIGWYAKRHNIQLSKQDSCSFKSYREFFIRRRPNIQLDMQPEHLISPCDGWLSIFPVLADSSFNIKGSSYQLADLLQDEQLAANYTGGDCLIFRLCASDYHHYCYIDNGYQGECHYIAGELHSVQPLACAVYPVYTLNRRCWSLLTTENFGSVVQTEIGALIVDGIFNARQNTRFCKGMEKGHFELAGSTIVLLFQKNRIKLRPELTQKLANTEEVRVQLGEWIGNAEK